MSKPLLSEEKDKLSLEKCRAVLNAGGETYTDEQVLKIRDYLYKLAVTEMEHFRMLREEGKLNWPDNRINKERFNQRGEIEIF